MEKEKAVLMLQELLQAVTFLIWFVLVWSLKKSPANTVLALRRAFKQSEDYKKEEILDAFKLNKNLF